jgi:cytochrome c oxidase assembly factor CtaG/putative copper export protein
VTTSIARRSLAAVAIASLVSLVSLVIVLVITQITLPGQFSDPGAVVRWGTPIVKLVMNFSMAIAIGSLVFSAFALNPQQQKRLQPISSWSAAIWLLSAAIYFVMTYLSAAGITISYGPEFSSGLWLFATEIELGVLLAWNLGFAFILSLSTIMFPSGRMIAVNAALAIAGLYPLAESGHASSDVGHAVAVNSMLMHLVGISVWVGGLIALFAIYFDDSNQRIALVKRYSTLALFAFILVAISGLTGGFIRMYEPADLLTSYGQLLIAKAVILVLLGLFGAWHRLRLIRSIESGSSSFIRIVGIELAIMGIALALATALARTAPPINPKQLETLTPAQILTGDPLPPELTDMAWLTVWDIDILWLTVSLLAIAVYLNGVRILHARGDKWPLGRTLSWVAGMLVLLYVTNGAPNAYQEYLFSVHMVGHMMLSMLVPVLLVPGAPVTLLSRAQAPRTDGSKGLREWVLWAVHTPYAWIISQPVFAGLNFALSLVMFYYTPLFRWATEQHLGHQWMIVHFLITGYLFVQSLMGVDPQPHKPPFPVKLMLLIGTMAFHAFFGLGLMNEKTLLLADWFGSMGRTWGDDPLADQAVGGAFAWGVGELPTIIITLVVVYQWSQSDVRERRRLDRASDRAGNRDVDDYNKMLEELSNRQDKRR